MNVKWLTYLLPGLDRRSRGHCFAFLPNGTTLPAALCGWSPHNMLVQTAQYVELGSTFLCRHCREQLNRAKFGADWAKKMRDARRRPQGNPYEPKDLPMRPPGKS